jgi:uncharacterized membrane protein YbhN (UPF0104 family)
MPLGTIVVLLPISISGLGTREVSLVFLFGFFGIPADKVVTFSIVGHLINLIAPFIIALISTKGHISKKPKNELLK